MMINNLSISEKKTWLNSILAFSILFLWVIYLFWNTFYGMVSIWARSETFTHGFLVLPIVVWLIWQKRETLISKLPKANLWLIFPIIATCILWLLGDLVSINSVTQLAAIALVVLLVFAIFGWSVASVIIFPLFFLFFAVPLGEFLLPLLMQWTAKFTVIAVRLSGVPVFQEGLQFVISSGSWSVVEACSGVRYLISSIMIGTLYAYLNYQSFNRRIIFICVSIIVPVFANWARAYFIVMLGHISGNKLAVGFDHLIYGWLFFGVVIMLMFLIGGRWAENINIDIIPSHSICNENSINKFNLQLVVFVIFVVLASPVIWMNFVVNRQSAQHPVLLSSYALNSSWKNSTDRFVNIEPNFQGASVDSNRIFNKDQKQVGLYIKYYRNQNYSNKLVNSENYIFSTKDKYWVKSKEANNTINDIENGLTVRVTDWKGLGTPGQIGGVYLQTWQFYWVNGVFTASDYKAKIYGALQRFLGKGDDSAVIILYAKDEVNNFAEKSLQEFLRDNYFQIKLILEETRAKL